MPVQNYLEAKKQVKKETDTLLFKIREAYNAAEESLVGKDGLVDLASLEDPSRREKFKDRFVYSLKEGAREYFGLSEESFEELVGLKQDRLLFAYLGTSETQIKNIVEGYKGNLDFNQFMEEIQKQMQEHLKESQQYPLTKISPADAPEVVRYTGLERKVAPERLELKDIVELLEIFERFKTVPPKVLENKPYLIR